MQMTKKHAKLPSMVMSRDMRFPTMWYVRPAKAQTSLRICAIWSESLLVAWVFYEYWTSFGVAKLKRKLHRLVWNATLLEITCGGWMLKRKFGTDTLEFLLLISGQAHEIHPPSKDQPGIVVHICEDPEGYNPGGMMPIVQTRCPERKTWK